MSWVDDGMDWAGGVLSGVGDWFGQGLDFLSDPLGYILIKAQEAAVGLANTVMPALVNATHPDLSLSWFLDAYQKSFGMAFLLYIVLLIVNLVRLAQNKISGPDMVDLVTVQAFLFMGGAAFGPVVGAVLIGLTGSLSDFFISWGVGGSSANAVANLTMQVTDGDVWGFLGGVVIGLILMAGMIIALFMVIIMLIVALVTLYFSGALFPLAWVWVTDAKHSAIAQRMMWVWLGICFSHPLMFFLLGISFWMISNSVGVLGEVPGLKEIMMMIAAILSMGFAAMSPALLFKFAPIMPTTAGQSGVSMPTGGGGGSGGGTGGGNVGSSSPGQASQDQAGSMPSSSGTNNGTSNSKDSSSGGPPPPGPIEAAAAEQQSQQSPGGDSKTGSPSGSSPGADPIGASSPTGAPSPSAASGGTGGTTAGAGGSTAAAGAESTAAAGAAETSTGAGAVIGIPTLIAAGAKAAAEKTGEIADAGGQLAGQEMGEGPA